MDIMNINVNIIIPCIFVAIIIVWALTVMCGLWKILQVRMFGKKLVGTVVGYKNAGQFRTWFYYVYEVKIILDGKEMTVYSVNSFMVENFVKPNKHLNCEIDIYYSKKINKCYVMQ